MVDRAFACPMVFEIGGHQPSFGWRIARFCGLGLRRFVEAGRNRSREFNSAHWWLPGRLGPGAGKVKAILSLLGHQGLLESLRPWSIAYARVSGGGSQLQSRRIGGIGWLSTGNSFGRECGAQATVDLPTPPLPKKRMVLTVDARPITRATP